MKELDCDLLVLLTGKIEVSYNLQLVSPYFERKK